MVELNREKRQALRRVQEHFNLAHQRHGAAFEQMSTVDVFYHPSDAGAAYNYVTPRRGVAWVPRADVTTGLDRLDALAREPRLELVKDLFPAPFYEQLHLLGLSVESDYPLLTYGVLPGCDQHEPESSAVPTPTHSLSLLRVADVGSLNTWMRLNLEGRLPDAGLIAAMWQGVERGEEAYFVVADDFTIAGGAGVIINPPTAQILTVQTSAPFRRHGIASTAIRACVEFAQKRDCSLIFTVASNSAAARLFHRMGFADLDRIITYTRRSEIAAASAATEGESTDGMAHSISTYR